MAWGRERKGEKAPIPFPTASRLIGPPVRVFRSWFLQFGRDNFNPHPLHLGY